MLCPGPPLMSVSDSHHLPRAIITVACEDVLRARRRVWWCSTGTCGRTSMDRVDTRTLDITLRNAVARGALDNYNVDAAMNGMWNAAASS
jgi:hypothetical protein